MKTVRQNVFETNSSSTHAVTLCVSHDRKPSSKPYVEGGFYDFKLSTWGPNGEDESWYSKLQLLGLYLRILGRDDEFRKVLDLVGKFADIIITLNEEYWNKVEVYSDTEKVENPWSKQSKSAATWELDSRFDYFTKDEYSDCVEDFRDKVEDILSNDQTIVAFVCSGGWFDLTTYYDG